MPKERDSIARHAADLGRRALTGSDLELVLADAASVIKTHLNADFSSILELLPDGRCLFLAGVGWNDGVVGSVTVEMSADTAAGHVIRTLTPLAIHDHAANQQFIVTSLLREHQAASSLLVPLYGNSGPLGVVAAHWKQPHEFLPDELAWLQILANTLAFRLANRAAQQAENSRLLRVEQMMAIGQVAAGVAHELRNPLTSIKGLIQVNLRDLTARGVPAEDLTVIEQEIRRMESTLQTFLDFAQPPKPNRQPTDLSAIVERVFALVGGRARKQQVALHFLKPSQQVTANVDNDQIQQLLLNLVLNALDAMPQGGEIELDLHGTRDRFVELYVRDNGPGISPSILPKVFETFVSSKETGVGLGLPLSRRIAEDHGGTLTAYNLPEAGACFLLRLPANSD
jgi:signal transduction histidine kinase